MRSYFHYEQDALLRGSVGTLNQLNLEQIYITKMKIEIIFVCLQWIGGETLAMPDHFRSEYNPVFSSLTQTTFLVEKITNQLALKERATFFLLFSMDDLFIIRQEHFHLQKQFHLKGYYPAKRLIGNVFTFPQNGLKGDSP